VYTDLFSGCFLEQKGSSAAIRGADMGTILYPLPEPPSGSFLKSGKHE
jgi:hypothetical protein